MPQWAEIESDFFDLHDFTAEPELIGYYLGTVDAAGSEYGTKQQVFQKQDGKTVAVWASFALNSKLEHIHDRELVRVVFRGYREFEKDGETRSVKQYQVFSSGEILPLEDVTEPQQTPPQPDINDDDIPF